MISKKEVFSRRFLAKIGAELNSRAFLLKKNFNLKDVRIEVNAGEACYTDGEVVTVGANFPVFHDRRLNASEVVSAMLGEVLHEFGHLIYTPFSTLKMAMAAMHAGALWPATPDNMSKVMKDYILESRENADRAYTYYKEMVNIIEDGRIEYLLFNNLSKYQGFIVGLKLKRMIMREHQDSIKNLLDAIDNAPDEDVRARLKYELTIMYMFQISKCDELVGADDEVYKHPLIMRMSSIADDLCEALDATVAEEMFTNANHIFCDLFDDMILPYLKLCENDPNEEFTQSNGDGDGSGNGGQGQPRESSAAGAPIKKFLKKAGVADAPNPSASTGAKVEANTKAAKTAATQAAAVKAASDGSDSSGDSSQGAAAASTSDGGDASGENAQQCSGVMAASAEGSSAVDQTEDADDGTGTSVDTSSPNVTVNQGNAAHGGTHTEWTYTKEDRKIARGIDVEAIGQLQTDEEKKQSEKSTQAEKLNAPKDVNMGNAHDGVQWNVNQVPDADECDKDRYKSDPELIAMGKTAARKVERMISSESTVKTAGYSGRKFRAGSVYRPLPKYFEKARKDEQTPDCAIYVVGDQSGSMIGERIQALQRTFIVLCEMAEKIKQLKFAAFGHHASSYGVYIDSYVLPDEKISQAKYKVAKLYTSGCNRDGAALRYVAEILKGEQAEKKLLIMISDGQPNAGGYGGSAAAADIQDAIKHYERFGIKVIAAAIGDDKENIRDIYGLDKFLDISDITALPDTLSALVGRLIAAR